MSWLVSTEHLTKKYGTFPAAEDIALHVQQGDIYGMIGRNGAGKTTTLKMISGLARPTKGSISLFGKTYEEVKRDNLFAEVGILIETPGIYDGFSAYDHVKMKCLLYGIDDDEYIYGLLRKVGLYSEAKRKVGKFSMGMKQRLGIALALVGDPSLVILDEPTNGLDPQGIVEIRTLIGRLNGQGVTFIISSHALGELERIANRYGIIHEGRLLEELTADEMKAKSGDNLEDYYFRKTGGADHAE